MLRELDRLRLDKSLIYGCLVLTMLLGGTLSLENINEYLATNDMKNQVKLVFDSYAGPNVKLAEIQQAAKALCGTYLSLDESDKSYSFFHDTVEEAVFLSYGNLYLTETLKLCSLRSLCKLCRVNNVNQDLSATAATLMLDLQPEYLGILIERFIKTLEKKSPRDFATIAEASVWSSDEFRNLFMDRCKTIHVLEDEDQNTILVHAANANNRDLAEKLLRDMEHICAENQQQTVSYLTKAAKASCIHKDICLFRQFIKTSIVNVNEILSEIVENGSEVAMEFLLQNGADINYRSKNGECLLHAACLYGRLDMIKLLLSKRSLPVNLCDSKGRSVCHSAASGGRVDILEFLTASGADPLCADNDGMNILHYACLEGNTQMAFHLMEKYSIMLYGVGKGGYTVPHCAAFGGSIDIFNKVCECMNDPLQTDYNCYSEETESDHKRQADPTKRTKLGETLLHMACLSGKLEMTKYLIEKYPDMINEVNKHKASIAHYAAAAVDGNISLLQYLIARGIDPWCKTSTEQSLLHLSCISGRLDKTQYLIEKYPNMIYTVDKSNRTPAHYAAYGGNVYVIPPLCYQNLNPWCGTAIEQTLLTRTCIKGQIDIVKYLAEKYPDIINKVDNNNATTAHYASESGNIAVLQYLIQQGQNPRCISDTKQTLLHMSCFTDRLEMTQYLLENYPTMINETDNCNQTPAHYAAKRGNVSVLQYLINQGLNPSCRTATQETLLHKSCIAGQLAMTKYLVENYPAMINETDNCNRTPAHYAAMSGNVTVLQYLIQMGLNNRCRTDKQQTLLHMSCFAGRLEMTKYLLENYPNMINETDNTNWTPAHYAAKSGNVSVLQYLINQGLNPSCRTATQETLLHMSCIAGQLAMTKYLVKKYPNMINEVDTEKATPAHYAAKSGNISILQYLIDQGLNPSCRTATLQTLLHMSCITGHLGITKYLVEHYSAMINETDDHNMTPAHYAAMSSNVTVLQYLIEIGLNTRCRTATQQTLLHMSCFVGQLEITQYLLEKFPNMINETDNLNMTPAHYAAKSSNVCALKYLIDKGLDPLCRTTTQQTLLHMSSIAGQLEMTQYLLEKYPNMINETDDCNRTPAHYAAKSSNVSVLQYLIDQGLNPSSRTATQQTLLHISCFAGQLEMTQYLLENYPTMINETDNRNRTPAHYAASSGNVSVLQCLINQGLNPSCRTATQETLLHLSCNDGRLEMTQYLLENYPVMLNETDNFNRTPAHYAASSGNVAVLQYLIEEGLDPSCRTATQQTLLHKSCNDGQLEMTQYLLEKYPVMLNESDKFNRTPAHYAAISGNVSVLKYLIDQGLNLSCRTATQQTLLIMSCMGGWLEMTKYLLEKNPNIINETDSLNGTAAHYAARRGNVSVLKYLIEQGLNPSCRTATQETLLHMSCCDGRLEMTQYLLEKYPTMINDVNMHKATPAHYAAESGNVSVLQYLIDKGLNPWCRTVRQETLLHMSCLAGQLEMTHYLLEKYPNMINEVDTEKATPAHYAAMSGNISVLQYLIDQGLNPLCRTATQQTLLHMSCVAGQFEMTKYLVENYPAMINETDNRDITPLGYVLMTSHIRLTIPD